MKKIALIILVLSNIAHARVTCSDFETQAEAQRWHDANRSKSRLDRDKDGEACECLFGGSSYGSKRCAK